mgnify:CR=1 FL=1
MSIGKSDPVYAICLLIQHGRLVCDFCSSGQRFACGFLQIPPRGGHPCRPANDSPCRVRRRLPLPSECALPGAQIKNAPNELILGVGLIHLEPLILFKNRLKSYLRVIYHFISPVILFCSALYLIKT